MMLSLLHLDITFRVFSERSPSFLNQHHSRAVRRRRISLARAVWLLKNREYCALELRDYMSLLEL